MVVVVGIVLCKGIRGEFVFPSTIDIGPLSIRIYALMILLSVVLAAYLCWKLLPSDVKKIVVIEDALLAVFVPGIVGARLYHVITDWYLYASDPLQAIMIWNGGLGIIGGLIGGGIGLLLYLRAKRIDVGKVIPPILVVLPLAQAIGRLGNLFNYELYGLPSDSIFAMYVPENLRPSYLSSYSYYHPLFLYEMIGNICLFFLLYVMYRGKKASSSLLITYIAGYGAIRYLLDFLRLDGNSGYSYLTYAQWLILATLFVIVLFGLCYQLWYMIKYKKLFIHHGQD
jgi:phosphatidylglycerol:prolipoprotein diacylglycerol transferase